MICQVQSSIPLFLRQPTGHRAAKTIVTMNIHSLNQIFLVWVFSAALTATALAQSTSKEKELQQKEAELQKKEEDLDRQRRELEDARKQLRLEETAQRVTIRLEGDVLFDTGKAQLRPEAQSALEKVAVVIAQFPGAKVAIDGTPIRRANPR